MQLTFTMDVDTLADAQQALASAQRCVRDLERAHGSRPERHLAGKGECRRGDDVAYRWDLRIDV